MKLILASRSPGRKKVLTDAGFVFDVMESGFEEDMTLQMPSHNLAMHLSQGKARDVAEKLKGTNSIVIGADTFGVFGNKFLGKPHTEEGAHRMLSMLSGTVHSMVTGVTVVDVQRQKEITRSVETNIWFREISHEEIATYVNTGEALEKAGGYAYQLNGHAFVERIEGSESNIIGLPIEELKQMLGELGMMAGERG